LRRQDRVACEAMKRPDEVKLSQADGAALIKRIEASNLAGPDQRLLVQLIRLYFWLTFALQETKLSLRRLKAVLFGAGGRSRRHKGPGDKGSSASKGPDKGQVAAGDGQRAAAAAGAQRRESPGEETEEARRRGHGRKRVEEYRGAMKVVCRHEDLVIGQVCPACGRGRLYRLPPGVEIRIDGNAFLSAIQYELEKVRCSACGAVFTAPVPEAAGEEKYTARARAVLVLGRYYLGVPFYRLESYQALVGVPVADATQWDQVERVADCAYPVFEQLKRLAAQGDVIYQDDTHVRILSLVAENRQAEEGERTGMYTTGLITHHGGQMICLYFSGRAHAGENLAELLGLREGGQGKPIVMSDALTANEAGDAEVIRCHCLAHGRRKFTEIDEVFPEECAYVIGALKQVFEHEELSRLRHLTAEERLAYHQAYSGPILAALKTWLEHQFAAREVEPNSSLGKACTYLRKHWARLTRFLAVPGAPVDNNIAERALKLMIRQRRNSLFYASTHSAYIGSLLTSLIATCVQAQVNALEYLVALQDHRAEVFRTPAAWLPWNYQATLAAP
jgi:transposase